MTLYQPFYLLNLINGFSVDDTNQVVTETLIQAPNIQSKYTPSLSLSFLSGQVKKLIGTTILPQNTTVDKDSFSWRISQVGLKHKSPFIYLLVQVCLLESVSFIYVLENDDSLIRYIQKTDVDRIQENLNYLADYFGFFVEDFHFSQDVTSIDLGSFGYQELGSEISDISQFAVPPFENYLSFVLDIRDLQVAFGYIKSQIDLLTGNSISYQF